MYIDIYINIIKLLTVFEVNLYRGRQRIKSSSSRPITGILWEGMSCPLCREGPSGSPFRLIYRLLTFFTIDDGVEWMFLKAHNLQYFDGKAHPYDPRRR